MGSLLLICPSASACVSFGVAARLYGRIYPALKSKLHVVEF
jgi:hypothetical protein